MQRIPVLGGACVALLLEGALGTLLCWFTFRFLLGWATFIYLFISPGGRERTIVQLGEVIEESWWMYGVKISDLV